MIKLFSLNHTRIRRSSILAQDKTQFRRVTVLIFRIRNTSASAHTNYLVNFLKSVRGLPDQGGVFYIESLPCQPLSEEFLNSKSSINSNGCLSISGPPQWRTPRKRCVFYRAQSDCQRFVITFSGNLTIYRQSSVFTAAAAWVALSLASSIELPDARATPILRRPFNSGFPKSLRNMSG